MAVKEHIHRIDEAWEMDYSVLDEGKQRDIDMFRAAIDAHAAPFGTGAPVLSRIMETDIPSSLPESATFLQRIDGIARFAGWWWGILRTAFSVPDSPDMVDEVLQDMPGRGIWMEKRMPVLGFLCWLADVARYALGSELSDAMTARKERDELVDEFIEQNTSDMDDAGRPWQDVTPPHGINTAELRDNAFIPRRSLPPKPAPVIINIDDRCFGERLKEATESRGQTPKAPEPATTGS